MTAFTINEIGRVQADEQGFRVELRPEYAPALEGLAGFDYVQVLWWFDGCDNASCRSKLTERKPYTRGPELLGTFATRSPQRPNPIAVSTAYVTYVDQENSVIGLAYIDADPGSPVLDLKPYTPAWIGWKRPASPPGALTGRRTWRKAATLTGRASSTSNPTGRTPPQAWLKIFTTRTDP